MKLNDVLRRLTSGWDIVYGESLYNSMKHISDSKDNETEFLADTAVEIFGMELLNNNKIRNLVIKNLTSSEAEELARNLDLKIESTAKRALADASFKSGSKRQKILGDYFGIEIPAKVVGEELPDIETIDSMGYPIYKYQKDVLLEALNCYNGKKSNLMIHMPTGSGKTRVAMSLICRILQQSQVTVLWLAYSEELCEQAIEEFKRAWKATGDRNMNVCRFYSNHDFHEIDEGLIVSGLSKLWLHSKKNPTFMSKLATKTSLVLFDEAHQSVAKTYMEMLEEFKLFNDNCIFIGLSATPGRTNENETNELTNLFDSKKITLKIEGYSSPINYLYDRGYLAKPIFMEIKIKKRIKQKQSDEEIDYGVNILKALGSDEERNEAILNAIREDVQKYGRKKIIVFAASVDSARYITVMLNYMGLHASIVTSSTESAVRANRIEEFKNTEDVAILCNYGVLTTGVDIPKVDSVVIARPTKSMILYSQMVGRALRGPFMGGTETADIITVIDTDLEGYGSVVQSFRYWDSDWGSD